MRLFAILQDESQGFVLGIRRHDRCGGSLLVLDLTQQVQSLPVPIIQREHLAACGAGLHGHSLVHQLAR